MLYCCWNARPRNVWPITAVENTPWVQEWDQLKTAQTVDLTSQPHWMQLRMVTSTSYCCKDNKRLIWFLVVLLVWVQETWSEQGNTTMARVIYLFHMEFTGWPKKVSHKVLSISLWNIDRFSKFLTGAFCGKFVIKWLPNIPPHLNCVATLPCEIWNM